MPLSRQLKSSIADNLRPFSLIYLGIAWAGLTLYAVDTRNLEVEGFALIPLALFFVVFRSKVPPPK